MEGIEKWCCPVDRGIRKRLYVSFWRAVTIHCELYFGGVFWLYLAGLVTETTQALLRLSALKNLQFFTVFWSIRGYALHSFTCLHCKVLWGVQRSGTCNYLCHCWLSSPPASPSLWHFYKPLWRIFHRSCTESLLFVFVLFLFKLNLQDEKTFHLLMILSFISYLASMEAQFCQEKPKRESLKW